MSETGNSDKTVTAAPPKATLHLKRPVEQGTVRQSFWHGRSKAVVVEKVKRRILTAGEAPVGARPAAAAPAAAPTQVAPTPSKPLLTAGARAPRPGVGRGARPGERLPPPPGGGGRDPTRARGAPPPGT